MAPRAPTRSPLAPRAPQVEVTSEGDAQVIRAVTDLEAGRLLLHWGLEGGKDYKGGWRLPEEHIRPEGTRQYKDRALQTPFRWGGGGGAHRGVGAAAARAGGPCRRRLAPHGPLLRLGAAAARRRGARTRRLASAQDPFSARAPARPRSPAAGLSGATAARARW